MTEQEERCWQYLLANRQATAKDVVLNCDVTLGEAEALMARISSPNWREEVKPQLVEGKKFDADKARYDLIPPEIEEAIAKVLTFGAKKYAVEVKNEWDAILLAPYVTEARVATQKGSVVAVMRNTYGQPIPSMQSASVKIAETGKPETQIESATWQSVDALIRQHVLGTNGQNGLPPLPDTASPKNATPRYALKGVQSAEPPNTCTLTIVTQLGSLEVFFAPDAITASAFWTTVWKGLSEHFGISRPQSKTGERNWELGMKWGRLYAALRRHMAAWWSGEDNDPETGMPHTWHACACLAFIVAYEQRGVGTDDRPTSTQSDVLP